ncbi:unnamed protein product [Rhizoctonia solani]|uniref:Uncharacterized protein n=1 Tax=Rhizoctonia solani TaxID=456999 RepID=A0A8H3CB72_9AGAM|nr:unnamed protein product [Rhizoctonia solani]
MPGGPVAAQLNEQPLIVEHDTREDENQPILPDDGNATPVIKKERTPLPWNPLIVLTALNAVCPLAFELVYPFVNSMIVEIGVTDDPERVGFYSGLIESIFSVMSLIMRLGGLSISITLPSKVKARRKAKRSPCSSGSSTPPAAKPTTPLLVDANQLETNRPSKKPTWRTVMTPSVLSLVVNNACMCIASEMLFSVYPLFAFTPITSGEP